MSAARAIFAVDEQDRVAVDVERWSRLVALVLERNDALADAIAREARGGGAVIGVLGMVHMNGVRRRLLESVD